MTDKAYRTWIQILPSCISGKYSEYVHGEGRCIAAHVRRAKNSGTGYKAEYSCVPLTNDEHQIQHSQGEAACLNRFLNSPGAFTDLQAKEWFDAQVVKYRRQWEARELGL